MDACFFYLILILLILILGISTYPFPYHPGQSAVELVGTLLLLQVFELSGLGWYDDQSLFSLV